ncbi:hypothetical protein BRC82_04955 [Halobacteriales archaeon QS_1_67_19]|nr:MAG: hypothetical protein BRC82_04955 [Halobacteriales archaeon QS_1_67_19]
MHPTALLERIAAQSVPMLAAAVLAPLVLASLVYLDARRRRGRSLAPLAWGAMAFFSGVGCVVVAACYVAVSRR